MAQWLEAARIDELPLGATREVVVADRIVALFHSEEGVHALDGVCPHQGGPLGKGRLSGRIVTCPWHGWQFDVTSGQHQLSRTVCQPRFPVRVVEGIIYVEVDG